jgi:hypothetical protein
MTKIVYDNGSIWEGELNTFSDISPRDKRREFSGRIEWNNGDIEWYKKGKKIAVYGEFENDTTIKGVDYISWKKFPFQHVFNILISENDFSRNAFKNFL